jgi:hypothetical protein
MLINIVVTTMAANPAVAFKPGDYLVSVGFRLRHGHSTMRKYMRINNTCQYEVRNYLRNTARIKSRVVGLAHLCVGGLPGGRLRRRPPGPPPFSSMNSTPANSKARRTARSLDVVIDIPMHCVASKVEGK